MFEDLLDDLGLKKPTEKKVARKPSPSDKKIEKQILRLLPDVPLGETAEKAKDGIRGRYPESFMRISSDRDEIATVIELTVDDKALDINPLEVVDTPI